MLLTQAILSLTQKKNALKYVICYSNTIPHPGIPLLAYYMYIYIPPDALSLYTESDCNSVNFYFYVI